MSYLGLREVFLSILVVSGTPLIEAQLFILMNECTRVSKIFGTLSCLLTAAQLVYLLSVNFSSSAAGHKNPSNELILPLLTSLTIYRTMGYYGNGQCGIHLLSIKHLSSQNDLFLSDSHFEVEIIIIK